MSKVKELSFKPGVSSFVQAERRGREVVNQRAGIRAAE